MQPSHAQLATPRPRCRPRSRAKGAEQQAALAAAAAPKRLKTEREQKAAAKGKGKAAAGSQLGGEGGGWRTARAEEPLLESLAETMGVGVQEAARQLLAMTPEARWELRRRQAAQDDPRLDPRLNSGAKG